MNLDLKLARQIFHMKRPPGGFLVDLVIYPDHYGFRIYRDNFDSLPESKRLAATEWVGETWNAFWAAGIPCEVEAEEFPPEAGK